MPLIRHAERHGMTLLELVAALAIAGLVLASAVLLLARARDDAGRIDRRARADAARANGARLLRQAIYDAAVPRDTLERFVGGAVSAEWTTMCVMPLGWRTRCRALATLDTSIDSTFVMLTLSTGEQTTVARLGGDARFVYLRSRSDSTWTDRWGAGLDLPAAIGIARGGDTTRVAIGARDE